MLLFSIFKILALKIWWYFVWKASSKYKSYENAIPTKMKLKHISPASPEQIFDSARQNARRAPFLHHMWNFPLFLRCLIFPKYMCAWCPHYNSKVFHRKNLLNAVILMGMSSPYDSSNQICGILKIAENDWFWAFSVSNILECAREKMLILGLPEVRMSVELGLKVKPWNFWHA